MPPDLRAQRRIEALEQLDILDTPPEAPFDAITRLLAAICDVPLARLSFVERDRQYFKSEFGSDLGETSLATSICAYAVEHEVQLLEICDTLADPRSADNPICTGPPHIRYYAGALIKTMDGAPIGTLCVLDHRPRQLDAHQREAMKVLARQIMTELDLRIALQRQTVLQREIDHRVKNSLQSVASFVRLQANRHDDPLAKEALNAVGRRVASVALLHQELAYEALGDEVALDRYMGKVAALFSASAPQGVRVEADIEPVVVDCTVATALAAIANEFVANSFKHAFPQERSGTVRLGGRYEGAHTYVLHLSDDGVGISSDAPTASGLGTRIMEASAGQIGASIAAAANADGHALTVSIPSTRLRPANTDITVAQVADAAGVTLSAVPTPRVQAASSEPRR